MSTRANIVLKDRWNEMWFYRHSDGYPEGTLPTLKKFMTWIAEGKLRSNNGQAGGALIAIGMEEYKTRLTEDGLVRINNYDGKERTEWQIGSYEPSHGEHGDIVYKYYLDLINLTIEVYQVHNGEILEVIDFEDKRGGNIF